MKDKSYNNIFLFGVVFSSFVRFQLFKKKHIFTDLRLQSFLGIVRSEQVFQGLGGSAIFFTLVEAPSMVSVNLAYMILVLIIYYF